MCIRDRYKAISEPPFPNASYNRLMYKSARKFPKNTATAYPAARNGPNAKWSFLPIFFNASNTAAYVPPAKNPTNVPVTTAFTPVSYTHLTKFSLYIVKDFTSMEG